MDLLAEIGALTCAIDAGAVPYALCGGLATALHGHVRATRGIDLLVLDQDLGRTKAIARALGFTAEAIPTALGESTMRHRVLKIAPSGEVLTLDLLVVGEPLASVWEARETRLLQGRSICVVSRPGLVSMKITAGRPQDLVDVQKLAELD